MCRSESVWQSSSGCQRPGLGEEVHIYNQITYLLCHDSRDGRPCQNVVPSAEDAFSSTQLRGSCPVCEAINRATEIYNAAEAQARRGPQEQYQATVQHASKLKQKELDDAYSVIRIIRPKRGTNLEINNSQKKRLTSIDKSANDAQLLASQTEQDSADQVSDDRPNQAMENAYITRKSVIDDPAALHPVYHVIAKPRKYFKPGRVFSVVWTEPTGPSKITADSKNVTPVSFDQYAWTEIRRFIVTRDMNDHCLALPIHTFGGRGSQKSTARPQDQRPVFAIPEDWDKSTLSEDAIPIKVEDPDIDVKRDVSFVLFSKHYSVEHYLPVRNIGYVVKEALPILEACFLHALGISDAVRAVGTSVTPNSASGLANSVDAESILGVDEQLLFTCDYDACHRTRQRTFSQKEAYRDHLRDFHREDLLVSRRTDGSWFNTRNLQEEWWRCKACLSRVSVSPNGFTCWSCNQPCEEERVIARQTRLEKLVPRLSMIGEGLFTDRTKHTTELQELSLEAGMLSSSRYAGRSTAATRHRSKVGGKSSCKSKRKNSDAKPYRSFGPSAERQIEAPEDALESETEPTASPSFLFQVNQLPINDDTSAGGVALRSNENGNWIPPVYSNGFGPQVTGNLYRWESNGTISPALDCQWVNGSFMSRETAERDSHEIQHYCTRTVFWCDPWAQFMVATGDSSSRHMKYSEYPHNRWWPLAFNHDGTISRVAESGPSQYLAGSGPAWIADLGLSSHVPRRAPAATGLSGNLAILVGMIALSCPAEYFDTVLTTDRPLKRNRWCGHNRGDGRSDERGVVVHIYLDPENPHGSTMDMLSDLEAEGPALIT